MITSILTIILLLLGSIISLIAAIGILRLPDLFTRMHAASKAGTAGSGFLLLAVAVQAGESSVWIKVLLVTGFFFLTAPVSAHLLAKAARMAATRKDLPEKPRQ